MAIPDIVRPGAKVSRDYLNALRETARRGAIQVAGPGLSALDTPGGMAVNLDPEAEWLENCRRMYYGGATPLLPCSLVHILNDDDSLDVIALPDFSGRRRLGVLREGAGPGNFPWVQYQGIARVLWDLTTLPAEWVGCATAALAGMRLGAKMHSPYAQWDENGPLLILNQPVTAGEPYLEGDLPPNTALATVRMDAPFADAVFCHPVNCAARAGVKLTPPPANFSSAYRCWNLGPTFNVREIAPGDISI